MINKDTNFDLSAPRYSVTLDNGQKVWLIDETCRVLMILPMNRRFSLAYAIAKNAGDEEMDYAVYQLALQTNRLKKEYENQIKHDMERDVYVRKIEKECEERIAWTIADAQRQAEMKWFLPAILTTIAAFGIGLIAGAFIR